MRVGIGPDPRIGYQFIYPGCGYGGSCFPKDVRALEQTALAAGHTPDLLHAVETVNNRQKDLLFSKIAMHFESHLAGKTSAVWGLAFKPNTDDMREASSRALIEALWRAGAKVRAFDPVANEEALRIYGQRPDLTLCTSAEQALTGADALVVVTEWIEFRSPDFLHIAQTLADAIVFDGRNIYDTKTLAGAGLKYYSVGRNAVKPS